MRSLWNSIQITYEYPLLSFVLVLVFGLLVLWRFSEGHLIDALRGLGGVLADIVRAPMRSLRRTTAMCRSYEDNEAIYQDSSVYLNWKLVQITSVALLIVCCIVMAGGIIGGFYSLYPSEQLEAREQIKKQVDTLGKESKTLVPERQRLQEAATDNNRATEIDQARKMLSKRAEDLQSIVGPLQSDANALNQWQAVERYVRSRYSNENKEDIAKQIDEFCSGRCEAAVASSIKSSSAILMEILGLEKKVNALDEQRIRATARLAEINRDLDRLAEEQKELLKQRAEIKLRPTQETVIASILFMLTALSSIVALVWLVEIGLELSRWIFKAMERLEKRL